MQTSTHDVTVHGSVVRKRFIADHEEQADREWACLTLLAERAPGLAARPLRRGRVEGAPVIVMERLPGQPLGGGPLTLEQTRAVGTALRRLYDVPAATIRSAGIEFRRYDATSFPQMLADWFAEEHKLDQCQDPEAVAAAVAVAREWLATGSLPEPRLEVLGIADLNPANVLWDGTVCRLVDFEDAGLSDPAYELADHVEHLGSRLTGAYDPGGLATVVGLSLEERDRMAAYRPLWAAFWLAMLLPRGGSWHRNPRGTTEAQAGHFLALAAGL